MSFKSRLSRAVQLEDLEKVRQILNSPDPLIAAPDLQEIQLAAMYPALEKGQVSLVKLFLDSGVPINSRYSHQQTILIVATIMTGLEMVQLLLERGADPNLQDASGETALMWAVRKGKKGLVKLMLLFSSGDLHLNLSNRDGHTALDLAAHYQQPEILEWLTAENSKPVVAMS